MTQLVQMAQVCTSREWVGSIPSGQEGLQCDPEKVKAEDADHSQPLLVVRQSPAVNVQQQRASTTT